MNLQDLRLSKQEYRIIQRHLSTPCPCVLCGTFPSAAQAIFTPDTPEFWGGKRGKVRLLCYGLCAACYALPDLTQHVEACLQASLGRSRN